jgi:hypothetical protein
MTLQINATPAGERMSADATGAEEPTAGPTLFTVLATAGRSSQLWLTPTCAMFDVPIEMGP